MSLLPDRITDSNALTPRETSRALRSQRRTELRLFEYSLGRRLAAEEDRVDAQAVADALRTSLDEELDFLDYGLRRAGDSPAKAELVARKLEQLAFINQRRIGRRFGA
jgi:hypothetical protein